MMARRTNRHETGLHADIQVTIRKRGIARLARRVLLGGLAISILLGAAAFLLELVLLRQHFADFAVSEALEFTRRTSESGVTVAAEEAGPLQVALERFLAERRRIPGGHFVLAEVYDPATTLLAQKTTAEAMPAELWMDMHPHGFPTNAAPWTRLILLDGDVYVQVVAPMHSNGALSGYFEGAYVVTPAVVARLLRNAARVSGLVALAVLATSLLLYPAIRALHRRLVDDALRLLHANLDTLAVLGDAIAKRDGETGLHSFRVTLIAIRLAEAAGLDAQRMRGLIKGAFLHDVGKIGVADSVLLKPGPLAEGEAEQMRRHVRNGLEIVAQAEWLTDAAEVVGYHHEWFDGSGYPQGLAGENIPLAARIFAIADVFDALTSPRPYKPALSLEESLAILEQGRGSHFDPHLLDLFRAIAPKVYSQVCCANDDALGAQLRRSTRRYFAESIAL